MTGERRSAVARGMKTRATTFAAAMLLAFPALADEACRAEIGEDAAQELVDQCLEVTPATHPPCNADNACALIQDEIARGCEMLGDEGPDFCWQ